MSKIRQLAQGSGLSGRLVEGVFGKPRELPAADPAHVMSMVIPVQEIDLYDRNPRREDNKVYEPLKRSIRAAGLDAPIGVTRRPGAEKFMVAAGGNTRLKIVQELWTETGEERFRQIICVFRPWVSEVEVLVAHLRENDLRDNLRFIDHAEAILDLKRLIEEIEGVQLKMSAFERRLKALGHEVSRRDLARMAYAKSLESAIPVALKEGMGPWTIDKIHLQHRNYQAYYDGLDREKPPFDGVFERCLKENDSDAFDLDLFRASLDMAISEISGIPSRRIRLSIDALGGGKTEIDGEIDTGENPEEPPETSAADPIGLPVPQVAPPADPPAPDEKNGPKNDRPLAPRRASAPPARTDGPAPAFPPPAVSLGERPPLAETERSAASSFPDPPPAAPIEPAFPAGPDPLSIPYLDPAVEAGRERFPDPADPKFMRSRLYALAAHFAAQGGIGPCLRENASAKPFGLALAPLPGDASERQTLFWHALASLFADSPDDPRSEASAGAADGFRRFLFRANEGAPPSPAVLRTFLLLIESAVALARATQNRQENRARSQICNPTPN